MNLCLIWDCSTSLKITLGTILEPEKKNEVLQLLGVWVQLLQEAFFFIYMVCYAIVFVCMSLFVWSLSTKSFFFRKISVCKIMNLPTMMEHCRGDQSAFVRGGSASRSSSIVFSVDNNHCVLIKVISALQTITDGQENWGKSAVWVPVLVLTLYLQSSSILSVLAACQWPPSSRFPSLGPVHPVAKLSFCLRPARGGRWWQRCWRVLRWWTCQVLYNMRKYMMFLEEPVGCSTCDHFELKRNNWFFILEQKNYASFWLDPWNSTITVTAALDVGVSFFISFIFPFYIGFFFIAGDRQRRTSSGRSDEDLIPGGRSSEEESAGICRVFSLFFVFF